MATATALPRLGVTVQFVIDEDEAYALDALAGYGDDEFIKAFYEKLGQHYMKPHEAGLRRFLGSIRNVVSPAIGRLEKARSLLIEDAKARAEESKTKDGA